MTAETEKEMTIEYSAKVNGEWVPRLHFYASGTRSEAIEQFHCYMKYGDGVADLKGIGLPVSGNSVETRIDKVYETD